MRIAALGAGPEIEAFLRAVIPSGDLVVFGAHRSNRASAAGAIALCQTAGIAVVDTLDAALERQPDIVFMASWPRLVPVAALAQTRFVNLHGALLPRYRGMHGGTWAIVNGERQHGYTIHAVDEGVDSGPIYYQGVLEPAVDDDVNAIRRQILAHLTANIGPVFARIAGGELQPVPQDESQATYVQRRHPEDGRIDWRWPAWRVYSLIRALAPPYTPGAFTTLDGERLWITRATWREQPEHHAATGQVVVRRPGEGVLVRCADAALLVREVTFRGATLPADELLHAAGVRLGS